MKPKHASGGAATTPTQIRNLFFDDPAQVTDAQLLALLLGTGTTRSAKGLVRKTWTAIELAGDLLVTAGGRLEHLVAGARRADFDRRHFGLGEVLGSRLVAAMELAHRWRRGDQSRGLDRRVPRRTLKPFLTAKAVETLRKRIARWAVNNAFSCRRPEQAPPFSLSSTCTSLEYSKTMAPMLNIDRELDRYLTLLRNKIRERSFTQLEVQESLGWGRSYISQIVTKQKSLRVEQVLLILDVIGIEPAEFFGELYDAFPRFSQQPISDTELPREQLEQLSKLVRGLTDLLREKGLITRSGLSEAIEAQRAEEG